MNKKFRISAVICFGVLLITDAHTQRAKTDSKKCLYVHWERGGGGEGDR